MQNERQVISPRTPRLSDLWSLRISPAFYQSNEEKFPGLCCVQRIGQRVGTKKNQMRSWLNWQNPCHFWGVKGKGHTWNNFLWLANDDERFCWHPSCFFGCVCDHNWQRFTRIVQLDKNAQNHAWNENAASVQWQSACKINPVAVMGAVETVVLRVLINREKKHLWKCTWTHMTAWCTQLTAAVLKYCTENVNTVKWDINSPSCLILSWCLIQSSSSGCCMGLFPKTKRGRANCIACVACSVIVVLLIAAVIAVVAWKVL